MGRWGVLTLLQHSSVCVDGLIDDRLTVSSLGHLLALHADLLALQDQIKLCLNKTEELILRKGQGSTEKGL